MIALIMLRILLISQRKASRETKRARLQLHRSENSIVRLRPSSRAGEVVQAMKA